MEFVTFLIAVLALGLWVRSSNLKRRINGLEETLRDYAPFLNRIGDLERELRQLRQPASELQLEQKPKTEPSPVPPPPVWRPSLPVTPLVTKPFMPEPAAAEPTTT